MGGMNNRPANDEFSIRFFYTACSAAAVISCLIAQFVHFYSFEPGTRTLSIIIVFAVLAAAPIWWLREVRRTPFGLPRQWNQLPLLIWAYLAPIAAFFVVAITLTMPWVAMFKYGGDAGLLTVPASALIVWLTWWIPDSSAAPSN